MVPFHPSSFILHPSRRSRGSIHWSVLAFLLTFTLLLLILFWYFLLPAADAARGATPHEKATLRAVSALLLAVVLFVLFVGLLLTLRAGRFFSRTPPAKPAKTQYVDAWAESGKRLQVPP